VTDVPRPEVRVFPDLETLSRAAADLFIVRATQAISSRKKFTVALSGGSTPRGLYTLLGSAPAREKIEWEHVHIFWADERCVPKDHDESNFKFVADTLLSRAPIPNPNIHRIRGEEGPIQAAKRYEEDLREFFRTVAWPVFDLIILGAGEDGHTASLFPGSPTLREQARFAAPVLLEPPKLARATLTLPVLDHAAQVLFLVSGKTKAEIVREILENKNEKQYPAGLVHPRNGALVWFIDREAAGLLTK
jgi:6-phosphogluconolactonase